MIGMIGQEKPARVAAAWGVHLFTATGAIIGTWALVQIHAGDYRGAALLLLVALAIDGADGTLARGVGVSRVLPFIDGRRLDDMIDFLNFVIVPAVFLVTDGRLVHPAVVALPILSSAYAFSREDAKTDDDFFLGFPSYWNIVTIYFWLLDLSPAAGTAWIVGLSVLCFVPIKFLYPTKMQRFRWITVVGGLTWVAVFAWAVLDPVTAKRFYLVELSLGYMAYYWGMSFWLGGIHHAERKAAGG